MNSLAIRALIALALAGAGFAAAWTVQGWRYGEQIAEMRREHIAAAAAENKAHRLKERALVKQVEDARNEATKREQNLRRAAANARNAADGLRDQLADLRRRLPDLADDAVRQRADTLAKLLGECSREYQALAESADRHASDVKSLTDAWPK